MTTGGVARLNRVIEAASAVALWRHRGMGYQALLSCVHGVCSRQGHGARPRNLPVIPVGGSGGRPMIDQLAGVSRRPDGWVRRRSGFAVLVVATLLIYAWRAPELLTKPQFWAEDGAVFFAQQFGKVWPQLFTPYWGYLNFLPRSIAWIVSLFDVRHAPFLYGFFGLIVDASCTAYVTRRSAALFAPAIVWLSLTIMPNDGLYYGYIANIQWFSQFVLIAMCLYPSKSAQSRSIVKALWTYALLAVCALTGPFSVIVAFLVGMVMAAAYIDRFNVPFRTVIWSPAARYCQSIQKDRIHVLCACALIQLATALLTPARDRLNIPTPRVVLDVFGSLSQVHFFGSAFLPAGLFLLVLALGIVLLLRGGQLSGDTKIVCVLMLLMATCELFLGASKPGAISAGMMGGDRYFFLGKTAAWWVIALVAAEYLTERSRRTLLVVATMVWISLVNGQWLRRAPLPDLNWSQQAKQIDSGIPVSLRINPWWWDNKVIIAKPPVHTETDWKSGPPQ